MPKFNAEEMAELEKIMYEQRYNPAERIERTNNPPQPINKINNSISKKTSKPVSKPNANWRSSMKKGEKTEIKEQLSKHVKNPKSSMFGKQDNDVLDYDDFDAAFLEVEMEMGIAGGGVFRKTDNVRRQQLDDD